MVLASDWHALVLPLLVMPVTANTVTVARMPKITMTINSSTSVKPLSCFCLFNFDVVFHCVRSSRFWVQSTCERSWICPASANE